MFVFVKCSFLVSIGYWFSRRDSYPSIAGIRSFELFVVCALSANAVSFAVSQAVDRSVAG